MHVVPSKAIRPLIDNISGFTPSLLVQPSKGTMMMITTRSGNHQSKRLPPSVAIVSGQTNLIKYDWDSDTHKSKPKR